MASRWERVAWCLNVGQERFKGLDWRPQYGLALTRGSVSP